MGTLARSPRLTAADVARALPWTRRRRAFSELGEFHQEFAVAETIAHLEHLARRREVTREDTGALIVYGIGSKSLHPPVARARSAKSSAQTPFS
jgi:hypothetical protein